MSERTDDRPYVQAQIIRADAIRQLLALVVGPSPDAQTAMEHMIKALNMADDALIDRVQRIVARGHRPAPPAEEDTGNHDYGGRP